MTTRKRVTAFSPTVVNAGGGVVVEGGTVAWGPRFGKTSDDTLEVEAALALDAVELTGQLAPQAAVALAELTLGGQAAAAAGVELGDAELLGSLTATSTLGLLLAMLDAAPGDDTWLEQANGGTAHGGDTELLCRQANVLGNAQQTAYLAWDLTTFDGFAGAPGTNQASFAVSRVGGLLAANLNYEVYTHPARPFDEATATWDADEPPPGTLLDTGQFANLGTALVEQTHTFTEADVTQAAGRWLYFRFVGQTGLGSTQQFRVVSKESTTATDRPALTATMELV